MYLKLVPSWNGEGAERRTTRIKEIDSKELDFDVRHPLDRDTGLKILEEVAGGEWSAIWSMPLHDPESSGGEFDGLPDWPEEGLSLIIFTIREGRNYQTYVAFDATMYVMSDTGKTIDTIN